MTIKSWVFIMSLFGTIMIWVYFAIVSNWLWQVFFRGKHPVHCLGNSIIGATKDLWAIRYRLTACLLGSLILETFR